MSVSVCVCVCVCMSVCTCVRVCEHTPPPQAVAVGGGRAGTQAGTHVQAAMLTQAGTVTVRSAVGGRGSATVNEILATY